jgi:hypothetical protein
VDEQEIATRHLPLPDDPGHPPARRCDDQFEVRACLAALPSVASDVRDLVESALSADRDEPLPCLELLWMADDGRDLVPTVQRLPKQRRTDESRRADEHEIEIEFAIRRLVHRAGSFIAPARSSRQATAAQRS